MTKPQLVLDIGGVLATNLSPMFWQLIASDASVNEEELYAQYKKEISEHLWTGELSEEQFWTWLRSHTPLLAAERARGYIASSLQPLPALLRLQEWSRAADLHVLSNHLPSWVETVVRPYDKLWRSVTISSEAGCKKPHIDIYSCVQQHLPEGSLVLFVDDQEKNLRPAASLGWRTLLADEEGQWITQVLPLLKQYS